MTPARFEVWWTATAQRDLERIVDYLEERAPGAAARVFAEIRDRSQRLSSSPLRGRVVPELARFEISRYRELLIPPYRLMYRVDEQKVWVVAVFDGRRDLESVLLARWLVL